MQFVLSILNTWVSLFSPYFRKFENDVLGYSFWWSLKGFLWLFLEFWWDLRFLTKIIEVVVLHEFFSCGNCFVIKLNLRKNIFKFKSFLPPSNVFYPTFQHVFVTFKNIVFQPSSSYQMKIMRCILEITIFLNDFAWFLLECYKNMLKVG